MFKLGAAVLISAAALVPPHSIPPPNLAARATRNYCFAHRGAGNPQASCSLNTRACPLKPHAYRCIDYYTITYPGIEPVRRTCGLLLHIPGHRARPPRVRVLRREKCVVSK